MTHPVIGYRTHNKLCHFQDKINFVDILITFKVCTYMCGPKIIPSCSLINASFFVVKRCFFFLSLDQGIDVPFSYSVNLVNKDFFSLSLTRTHSSCTFFVYFVNNHMSGIAPGGRKYSCPPSLSIPLNIFFEGGGCPSLPCPPG